MCASAAEAYETLHAVLGLQGSPQITQATPVYSWSGQRCSSSHDEACDLVQHSFQTHISMQVPMVVINCILHRRRPMCFSDVLPALRVRLAGPCASLPKAMLGRQFDTKLQQLTGKRFLDHVLGHCHPWMPLQRDGTETCFLTGSGMRRFS